MKIVVFGGDGFIGSYLVECFVASGHQVTVFDRFPFGVPRNLTGVRDAIQLVSGEFANREDLSQAVAGKDIVFHCISATNPASSWNDPFIEIDENIRQSVQLFEIAAQKGVAKVVYLSSGGTVYGKCRGMIDENTLPRPFSPYGIGKLTVENFLNYYQENEAFAVDIYRIGNAFGPRQPMHSPQGVIAKWMDNILYGRELLVYGNEESIRDYIYVGDIAKIIAMSSSGIESSGTFNVGTRAGVAITELLELFKKVVDLPFSYQLFPKRDFDNVSVILDNSRILRRQPGFVFSNFEQRLKETWQYVKSAHDQSAPQDRR